MQYCFINYASHNFYFLNFTWVKELFQYFYFTLTKVFFLFFFPQVPILFVKYRMWMALPLLLHFQTGRSNKGSKTEQSKQQRAKCEFVCRSAAFYRTINPQVLLDKSSGWKIQIGVKRDLRVAAPSERQSQKIQLAMFTVCAPSGSVTQPFPSM